MSSLSTKKWVWPKRIHWFEFDDLAWFPATFRDALTAWLRVVWIQTGAPKVLAPVLREILRESRAAQIVDLCSGAGGPLLGIQQELEASGGDGVKVILTDKFPNIHTANELQSQSRGRTEVWLTSVDATAIPHNLPGLRTLFNSFHHFRPGQARRILEDAYQARQPIAIFEIVNRNLNAVLSSFFSCFITVLLLMPAIRPRRPAWLLFTYLIPVIPFFFSWDALVSHLRAYTPEELLQMTGNFTDSYRWEIRTIDLQNGLFVTALLGLPQQSTPLSRGT